MSNSPVLNSKFSTFPPVIIFLKMKSFFFPNASRSIQVPLNRQQLPRARPFIANLSRVFIGLILTVDPTQTPSERIVT